MGKKFDIAKFAASLEQPPDEAFDIEVATSEVLRLKRVAGCAILELGDWLIRTKANLPHGEWLAWLTDRVDIPERGAQRFMRLAREWRNPTALSDLGATKALTLLALPPEERDAFIAETHSVGGEEKTVVDMTSRELEKAIRERDEARQAMEAAQAEAQSAEESRAKMETDMTQLKALHASAQQDAERAREDLQAARAELEALRARPVEVAVERVPDLEAVQKAREEAIREMQAKADAAEAKLAEVQKQLEDAAKEAKQAALDSDPELAAFRAILEQVPPLINQLHGRMLKIQRRDEAAAGKMKNALLSLAEQIRRCAE